MPIDGTKFGTSRQGGSLPAQPKRIMSVPAPTCARVNPLRRPAFRWVGARLLETSQYAVATKA
jgi:hypothetical protein